MLKRKLILPLLTAMTCLTACNGTSVFDKIMGAPEYTGTVVKHVKDDDDTTDLYKVTLDKVTLYHYYIPVTDIENEESYMTVKYDSEEKQYWMVDGDKVTNHGYVFVHWGKVIEEETTSEEYVSTEVVTE